MPNPRGRPRKIAAEIAVQIPPLPVRITLAERAFYEIRKSGVYRDLNAGDVIVDQTVIAEVMTVGASWY